MVNPDIIVTRAEPGASETMRRLGEAGYSAICSPMLELKALEGAVPDLSGIHNLVFTSANGVRFFLEAMGGMTGELAGLTAWCVGPATRLAAHEAGFERFVNADGNADDLARHILASPDRKEGYLHIANSAAAGNLVSRLVASGRDARFLALYETIPVTRLTEAAAAAIETPDPCIILLHSAKGAEAFRAASEALCLDTSLFVAISEAAGAPLKAFDGLLIHYADRPNEESLMNALARACQGL